MPGFYFHTTHLWQVASEARDRAKAVAAASADSPAVDALAAIILAAAASEGFINELSELCTPHRPDTHLPAALVDFGQKLKELEEARSPTLAKYQAANTTLPGPKFDKEGKLYYDFVLLFRVRDTLMHIKAIDQVGPRDDETETQTFTMPDLVKQFQGRGLARPSKKDVGASWLDALETDKMASWACETALNMMLAVLDMIPDFPGDPTAPFKRQLKRHKTLP